jgi:hypothetical protein
MVDSVAVPILCAQALVQYGAGLDPADFFRDPVPHLGGLELARYAKTPRNIKPSQKGIRILGRAEVIGHCAKLVAVHEVISYARGSGIYPCWSIEK